MALSVSSREGCSGRPEFAASDDAAGAALAAGAAGLLAGAGAADLSGVAPESRSSIERFLLPDAAFAGGFAANSESMSELELLLLAAGGSALLGSGLLGSAAGATAGAAGLGFAFSASITSSVLCGSLFS